MNIACPTCATTYRVDPAKVPATGVRARCQVCAAVFPISKNGTAPAPRPSTAAGAPAQRPAIPAGLRPSGMVTAIPAAPPAPAAAPAPAPAPPTAPVRPVAPPAPAPAPAPPIAAPAPVPAP